MVYIDGEEIEVVVDREGLGSDQGIGHLPDETMVVITGAASMVGRLVRAVITGTASTPLGSSVLAAVKSN